MSELDLCIILSRFPRVRRGEQQALFYLLKRAGVPMPRYTWSLCGGWLLCGALRIDLDELKHKGINVSEVARQVDVFPHIDLILERVRAAAEDVDITELSCFDFRHRESGLSKAIEAISPGEPVPALLQARRKVVR